MIFRAAVNSVRANFAGCLVDVNTIGKQLLHQQLYVIGRDIVSKHGNLLCEYGCIKSPSPVHGIPSTYTTKLSRCSRLALRGFGVFIGDDTLGGIFVHRYTFEPRWMPSSYLEPIPWVPNDMPRTRRSRSRREKECASSLLKLMVAWFIDYENWIVARRGIRFRIGQLAHFPVKVEQKIFWNMAMAWQEVYQQC